MKIGNLIVGIHNTSERSGTKLEKEKNERRNSQGNIGI